MAAPLVRAYRAQIDDIIPAKRTLVARINTAAVDRYNTVIDPRGINLKNYLENRVVLWEHGRDPVRGSEPIGRNSWIKPAIGPNGPELLAKTEFYGAKDGDEFAERIGNRYLSGDLRGFSINIVPDEARTGPPTHDEVRERPELRGVSTVYRGGDLAEYSAVAVPGNPEALTMDEARSVLRCLAAGIALPAPLVDRARRGVLTPELVARYITHEDGQWIVHAEDGKVLGKHPTKGEAEAQLAAVEAHKHQGDRSAPARPPAEPVLPPLAGRPFTERRAEVLGQLTRMFDEARAELEMQADFRRGRV